MLIWMMECGLIYQVHKYVYISVPVVIKADRGHPQRSSASKDSVTNVVHDSIMNAMDKAPKDGGSMAMDKAPNSDCSMARSLDHQLTDILRGRHSDKQDVSSETLPCKFFSKTDTFIKDIQTVRESNLSSTSHISKEKSDCSSPLIIDEPNPSSSESTPTIVSDISLESPLSEVSLADTITNNLNDSFVSSTADTVPCSSVEKGDITDDFYDHSTARLEPNSSAFISTSSGLDIFKSYSGQHVSECVLTEVTSVNTNTSITSPQRDCEDGSSLEIAPRIVSGIDGSTETQNLERTESSFTQGVSGGESIFTQEICGLETSTQVQQVSDIENLTTKVEEFTKLDNVDRPSPRAGRVRRIGRQHNSPDATSYCQSCSTPLVSGWCEKCSEFTNSLHKPTGYWRSLSENLTDKKAEDVVKTLAKSDSMGNISESSSSNNLINKPVVSVLKHYSFESNDEDDKKRPKKKVSWCGEKSSDFYGEEALKQSRRFSTDLPRGSSTSFSDMSDSTSCLGSFVVGGGKMADPSHLRADSEGSGDLRDSFSSFANSCSSFTSEEEELRMRSSESSESSQATTNSERPGTAFETSKISSNARPRMTDEEKRETCRLLDTAELTKLERHMAWMIFSSSEGDITIEGLQLFTRLVPYLRGCHHLEEIMLLASVSREVLLDIVDKFRPMLRVVGGPVQNCPILVR